MLLLILVSPFYLLYAHRNRLHRLHEGIGIDATWMSLPLEMEIVEESRSSDMTPVAAVKTSQTHRGIAPRYHDKLGWHL